jgi:hypothetical protein
LGLVEYPPPKELGLVENLPPEELQNEYESFKIFGLPNEDSKKAAEEYYKLLPTPRSPERTTKIGKLYGYTDQEIANLISGKAAPAAPAAAPVATEAAPVATEAAPSVTPTTKLLDANDMQDLPVELQNLIKTFKNC